MLPDLRPNPTQEEIEEAAELREARELERHAQTGNRKMLSKLSVGDRVKVWNSKSKRFDREWKVVVARKSGQSYILKDEVKDKIYMRNRRHLFPCSTPAPINIMMSEQPQTLKSALKNKITRKRTCIIHPRVLFMTDIKVMDEKGNKTFKEMAIDEEEEDEEVMIEEKGAGVSG